MERWTYVAVLLAVLIGGAWAQDGGAASQPAPAALQIDLSTPLAAVNSYLRAWRSGAKAEENIERCLAPAGAKAKVVKNDITHRLWRNYLERVAIAKFGPTEGIKVLGDARGFDEQLDIDLKRAAYANVDPDPVEKGLSRVYLKPEKDPVWGNDGGEFAPRSRYVLRQVGQEWRIDYVKTYELDSQMRTDGNRDALDLALYPRINAAFQSLAAGIKKGEYATAEGAKNVVEQRLDEGVQRGDGEQGRRGRTGEPHVRASETGRKQVGEIRASARRRSVRWRGVSAARAIAARADRPPRPAEWP